MQRIWNYISKHFKRYFDICKYFQRRKKKCTRPVSQVSRTHEYFQHQFPSKTQSGLHPDNISYYICDNEHHKPVKIMIYFQFTSKTKIILHPDNISYHICDNISWTCKHHKIFSVYFKNPDRFTPRQFGWILQWRFSFLQAVKILLWSQTPEKDAKFSLPGKPRLVSPR